MRTFTGDSLPSLRWAIPMLVAGVLPGCSEANVSDAFPKQEIVYVCTETGKIVRGPAQATPAVNPDTGKKTLMPGLYCKTCDKWYPSPPLDVAQRNPTSRLCPKHRTPLEADGPM